VNSYLLSKKVVLEPFEEGALVLVPRKRRLVALNQTAVDVIGYMEGRQSLEDIAAVIARNNDIPLEQATQDIQELCEELERTGVLEARPDIQLEEKAEMDTTITIQYRRNPDVVLREEDLDEGALLFNPDTSEVKILNTTGLFIWQQCSLARTLEEIVAEVRKAFDEVPTDQVAQDVKEFVDGMVANGFIGTVK
jgi:hypothetical protein